MACHRLLLMTNIELLHYRHHGAHGTLVFTVVKADAITLTSA